MSSSTSSGYQNIGQFAVKIASDIHSYDYHEPLIYQFSNMPTVEQLTKLQSGAYVIVKNPTVTAWKIDQDNLTPLNWPTHTINDIFKHTFTPDNAGTKNKLSTDLSKADFYVMHQLPDNPVNYLADIKGNNRYAYILCNNTLYLVDRVNERIAEQQLNAHALEEIKDEIVIPELDLAEMIKAKEINAEDEMIINHLANLRDKLLDESIPLNNTIDERKINEIIEQVTSIPGNSQGVYKIYKAVLDTQSYTPNLGSAVNAEFLTPSEYDEVSVSDSLKDLYKNKLMNKTWVTNQLKKQADNTVLNPDWVVDKLITLINKLSDLNLVSVDPARNPAAAAHLGRMKMHSDFIVKPRTGLVYTPQNDINSSDISSRAHYVANELLAVGKIPTVADTWIVSDADFNDISQSHLIGKDTPNTFICFSEEDAKNILQAIKANCDTNLELLSFQAKTFDLSNNSLVDKQAAKTIAQEYSELFKDYAAVFDILIKRQDKYQDELQALADPVGILNRGGPMEYRLLARSIWNDFDKSAQFPHFDKIKDIYKKLTSAISDLENAIQHDEKLAIRQVNVIIDQIAAELKSYVRQYPYLSDENSLPHMLLKYMSELNNYSHRFVLDHAKAFDNQAAVGKERDKILTKCNRNTQDVLVNYFKKFANELNQDIVYADATPLQQSQIKLELFKQMAAKLNTTALYNTCRDKKTDTIPLEEVDKYIKTHVFKNKPFDSIVRDILYQKYTHAAQQKSPGTLSLFAKTNNETHEPALSPTNKITPGKR